MLILHLPVHFQGVYDVFRRPSLQTPVWVGACSLDELAAHSHDAVAVIPWQRLAWHTVVVPPKVGKRWPLVLKGLMEERLLQDPEQVHMVPAEPLGAWRQQGGECLLAVCDKSWLREVIDPLQAAGIKVLRWVPELSPTPEPQLQLIAVDGQAQAVLTDAHHVWRLPPDRRNSVVSFENPAIWCEPSVTDQAYRWSEATPQIQTVAQRLAKAVDSSWQLAQGEWALSSSKRLQRWLTQTWEALRFQPAWQSARWGLLACLLVQMVGLNAWAWREKMQQHRHQTALKEQLLKTFPHVSVVVNAPLQMRKEVDRLAVQKAMPKASDMDSMLQVLAKHWPHGLELSSIHYQSGELRVSPVSEATQIELGKVAWGAMGYQWRVENGRGFLQAKAAP